MISKSADTSQLDNSQASSNDGIVNSGYLSETNCQIVFPRKKRAKSLKYENLKYRTI